MSGYHFPCATSWRRFREFSCPSHMRQRIYPRPDTLLRLPISRRSFLRCVAGAAALVGSRRPSLAVSADTSDYEERGFRHLQQVMDQYHRSHLGHMDGHGAMQYDLPDPQALRFLASYQAMQSGLPDQVLANTAFLYDNIMAMLAFMSRDTQDDWRRATILANSIVAAQAHDRFYSDGRLRNAYQTGDLIDRHTQKARLPGWWHEQTQQWFEDRFQMSSHTGNQAWAMIGLLRYAELNGGTTYLRAARQLGEWIYTHTADTRGAGGYTGGYEGWEPMPTKLLSKSVEHNVDVYVAFMKLWALTGDSVWRDRARWAKSFVRAMWNAAAGNFWVGTTDDGVTINTTVITSDVQNWALMALGEASVYGAAVTWVQRHCFVTEPCCNSTVLHGVDFNDDGDGIWWEGTAHTVVAWRMLQNHTTAEALLHALRHAQQCAPNANGEGIVATCYDGVSTGLDWQYYNRLHIGATAWYLFAERQYNPFWGIQTDMPVPYEGE